MNKPVKADWNDQAMEAAIGHLLRIGVTISAVVVLVGGVLYLLQQRGIRPNYIIFQGSSELIGRTVDQVVRGTILGDGRSVILLGLLLLILTPVVRVLFAAFGFLWKRDWMYTAISAGVFAILMYSLIFGR